jgi:iron(II)-dependent oxidoreductase
MIGVALLVGARRWRRRNCVATATAAPSMAHCDSPGEHVASPVAERRVSAPEPGPAVCRVHEFVDALMAQGRYALLLRPQIAGNLSPKMLALARERLERQMALIPEGDVLLEPHLPAADWDESETAGPQGAVVHVAAAFLDRYAVTNRQFQVFVGAGGYDQMAIWDPMIWPAVLNFVDSTGHPGPRYWQHGHFPPGKADHPVVGVCWYEAAAYARWIGKRLPADAEWLKAGCWPVPLSADNRMQRKFPWGNAMDRSRANLWGSGPGDTVAVEDFELGLSVGGISQLIGNVWEWTMADFEVPAAAAKPRDADLFATNESAADQTAGEWSAAGSRTPLKVIRGAAFDSYFDHQATCQFASGDHPLARKYNIGFRLALGLCDLVAQREAEPESQLETDAERPAASEEMLQTV